MRTIHLLCLILVVALSVGALGQTAGSDAEHIKAALDSWVRAFNSQDWQRTLDLWDENALVTSSGSPDTHYADLKASVANRKPSSDVQLSYRLELEEVEVSGDMAYVRDTWYLTRTVKATGKSTISRQRSLEIWRKRPDGEWRVTRAVILPDEQQSNQG